MRTGVAAPRQTDETMSTSQTRGTIGLTELVGLGGDRIIWGRWLTFLVAVLGVPIVPLIYRDFNYRFGHSWIWWLTPFLGAFIWGVALIALRAFRNEWVGFISVAALYAVAFSLARVLLHHYSQTGGRLPKNQPLYLLTSTFLTQPAVTGFLWALLYMAGLTLGLRLIESRLGALLAGHLMGNIATTVMSRTVESLEEHHGRTAIVWPRELSELSASVVFALILWAGLRLAWCKPELLGRSDADERPRDDLQRAFDFRKLRGHLRSSGIGGIVWGGLAVLVGAVASQNVAGNTMFVVLGLVLMVEGVWLLVAPSIWGLVVDGLLMMAVAMWSTAVIAACMPKDTAPPAQVAVLAVVLFIWGCRSWGQYQRYGYLSGGEPTAEELRRYDAETADMLRGDLSRAADVIAFKTDVLFNHHDWHGKLLAHSLLLVRDGHPKLVASKADVQLFVWFDERSPARPFKGKLGLGTVNVPIAISRKSLNRLREWKGVPAQEAPPSASSGTPEASP
jgi:hypothetical protein